MISRVARRAAKVIDRRRLEAWKKEVHQAKREEARISGLEEEWKFLFNYRICPRCTEPLNWDNYHKRVAMYHKEGPPAQEGIYTCPKCERLFRENPRLYGYQDPTKDYRGD